MKIEEIARVAHETNRAYCLAIGDNSQLPWDAAPEWQTDSAINGVQFHLDNPNAGKAASHESWLKQKEDEGWVYGEVKDPVKKEHHCMVPFSELPLEQQVKDALFVSVVHAMKCLLVGVPVAVEDTDEDRQIVE